MKHIIPGILLFVLILSGCEINNLKHAEDLYRNRRFAGAIEALDEYIREGENGAMVTRAELIRSDSYYELGLIAVQRQNLPMAIQMFKLSNSVPADEQLAIIYRDLANRATETGDIANQVLYINNLIREIPTSVFVPEMLYRRISIKIDVYNDRDSAWQDYMYIYDMYQNNSYELQARNLIRQFISYRADYAIALMEQEYFFDSLSILFELARYPVMDFKYINRLIADNYQAQAEMHIIDQDYIAADHNFRIAIQYYPEKKPEIDRRLNAIASMFIEKGNSLLEARDFENALIHYQKIFDIIPDHVPALNAINNLFRIRENIQRALQLFAEAERLDVSGKYSDALKLYQEAFQLDAKPEYRTKINQMQNLIEATRNPSAFAQRIVTEYKNGILPRKIENLKAVLRTKYKANEIRDSGWKILLSTGQHKYEVRYDILTPQETYFYIWQVNLKDRNLVPLNKQSELLMQ